MTCNTNCLQRKKVSFYAPGVTPYQKPGTDSLQFHSPSGMWGIQMPTNHEVSLTELQHPGTVGRKLPEKTLSIPITRVLVAIWVRRNLLLLSGVFGAVLGGVIACILPDRYTSSASLMPPDASSLTQTSAINMTGSVPLSLGASLGSQRTPGATIIGILNSRSEQDALIHSFDLQRCYKASSLEATRQNLIGLSFFEEDKKSGIVTIKVTDRDRVQARDLAQGYVEELNKLLNRVSTSSASKEHAFLEARLAGIKNELDQSSSALSRFSSRHETLNPAGQGAALIQSQAVLKSQLGVAQSELSALQAVYTDRNVRVQAARARLNTVSAQLRQMDADPASERQKDNTGTPSLRQLPILTVTYADLSRQVATQQIIYESLTKQLEVAKLQEAKEIPVAKELDIPVLAETRSSPHRFLITLSGFFIGSLGAMASITFTSAWRTLEGQYGLSSYVSGLLRKEQELHGRD